MAEYADIGAILGSIQSNRKVGISLKNDEIRSKDRISESSHSFVSFWQWHFHFKKVIGFLTIHFIRDIISVVKIYC